MRFYILFIATFVFAISANASITEKRELPVSFQGCSNDMTKVLDRIVSITKTVNKATDYVPIKRKLLAELESGITKFYKNAEKSCCGNFALNMNAENAAIIAFLSPFADEFVNMETAFINKKTIIEKNNAALRTTLDLLRVLPEGLERLFNCVISKSPANSIPDKTALFDKINKIHSDTKVAYPILYKKDNLEVSYKN